MKALVYTGTQELIYRDEKNPTEVDGESILKVYASGICGSDMHAYHGHDERRVPPLIIGHEVSGQVQNGKFKDKDVVLNPLITCGKCNYCINGREHLCPKRVILGMNRPIERQGVFAEYVATPDQNIYEIPDGLDKNEAPVAEPTAVSLHAVLIGEQSLKKPLSECRTLVQGAGAIGLLCALVLSKIKGNKDIIISDPNKLRLNECSKYVDAKFVSPASKDINSNSFDIVFDTVGLEASRQQAIEVVKPGGSIIHIGLTQPAGPFNFRKMTLQEVTVIGTYCYTNKDFAQTLEILSNKDIGPLDWIEFRDLKNGANAFKEIHNGSCIAPKIILLP
ncbi:MAG: alcohol dehydrogenase catalytic domain-containing protein [Flavobacterium sp.]|jgi:threonine dehydrogenase-like Zn-dependent dehydrogenase|nr:alcohol dehydrogenase catalytic domain-containing protein [Flavobacterium sp.]